MANKSELTNCCMIKKVETKYYSDSPSFALVLSSRVQKDRGCLTEAMRGAIWPISGTVSAGAGSVAQLVQEQE